MTNPIKKKKERKKSELRSVSEYSIHQRRAENRFLSAVLGLSEKTCLKQGFPELYLKG